MDRHRLVTERLVLQPITRADADRLAVLHADARVMNLLKHGVLSRHQSDALVADYEAEWSALLESLRSRGLEGKALRLVITDGAPGLLAAIRLVYPYAAHQRCWVHKLRNVVNNVRKADQPEVTAGAQQIYLAATRRDAIASFRRWKQRWQQLYPKAVACLERDLEELLACFDYPPRLRPKIRTTNTIERAFREVRRRTRPMTAFSNDASCERIVYALFEHLNALWGRIRQRHSTHKS